MQAGSFMNMQCIANVVATIRVLDPRKIPLRVIRCTVLLYSMSRRVHPPQGYLFEDAIKNTWDSGIGCVERPKTIIHLPLNKNENSFSQHIFVSFLSLYLIVGILKVAFSVRIPHDPIFPHNLRKHVVGIAFEMCSWTIIVMDHTIIIQRVLL